MHPSYQLLFQNLHEGLSDEALYAEELRLAELAEPLGFSAIWCVEHHFDGEYSMCPDNTQLLTYLAARTQDIKLVTAAIIVPWNDPLRVVEKVVLLDYASQGRLVLGLGRGLAKSEYAMFGLDMNEARERFDEATAMILRGLETGIVEGDGPFYRQPRATIRPAPTRGFRDRLVCIAMSPDSIEVAANLKAAMATFVQFPIEQHRPLIETYRARYREAHGVDAPPPTLTEFVYCHADAAEAERVSHEHMQPTS